MPLAFEDINPSVPQANTGGIADHILVIEAGDLTSVADVADTALAANGAIAGSGIVVASGKSFKRIDCVLDKGQAASTKIGGRGHGAWRNQAMGHVAAPDATAAGMAAYWNNKKIVALVPDRNTGNYRLVGTKLDPAFIQAQDASTGEGPEGENAWKFTIEATGKKAPYVTGTVTLTGS